MPSESSIITSLSHALQKIRSTPPRIISSPPTQPRRAAVALLLRVVPPADYPITPSPVQQTLPEFFSNDWVNAPDARAEILFLRREKGTIERDDGSRSRGSPEYHVAFPGGRQEEGDEGGQYTAMRQTWEEVGIDLAETDYICVGQLDDREITTSLGKRLLMVLSPFVFLQLSPHSPQPDPSPEITLHWTPLSILSTEQPTWSHVTVDISSRLAPKNSAILRLIIRALIGSMRFPAILLNGDPSQELNEKSNRSNEPPLKLWGLTLGMTLDLIAYMYGTRTPRFTSPDDMLGIGLAPSMTSVFPRFSYPDVNFWIWVFGKRYREVVRGWEASIRAGGSNDRRINWTGTALNTFYAAVRKALVLVLVLRGIGLLVGSALGTWWIFFRSDD